MGIKTLQAKVRSSCLPACSRQATEALLEPITAGEPDKRPLRWTSKRIGKLTAQVQGMGHLMSHRIVNQIKNHYGLGIPVRRAMKTPRVRHIVLWGMLFCAVGCAGSRQEVLYPTTVAKEEFDPQTLNDEDFLLQPPASGSATISQSPAGDGPSKQVEGYRVQIAAVLDRTRAEAFRAEAGRKLNTSVYIYYDEDTHLYKIQVGNSRTAKEAERLRREAKGRGYREAFVVRAQVEVAASPVRRPVTVLGYRVQIFSASSQQAAEQAQTKARDLLGREDIYIEFEPPFFKVRVGNFRKRKEAEEFIKVVKQQGYDTPFSVQMQISVSPE